KLVIDKENVVVTSVVPGKPEILVFAVPCTKGTYKGFEYSSIAITFNASDLTRTLELSSFDGQSSNYIIFSDGRILVGNNVDNQIGDIFNFVALLKNRSDLSIEEVKKIQSEFLDDEINVRLVNIDDVPYYMVYESAGIEDWVIMGIVPASVVNSSMNDLQQMTISIISFVAVGLSLMIILVIFNNYRSSLKKKDIELMYREELFSVLSNNVDDVFLMIDADGNKVDYVSPNSERLLGISDEALRKDIRNLEKVLPNNVDGTIIDEIDKIEAGSFSEWEREYIHQNSHEKRWFYVIALCREIQGKKKYILSMSDRTKERNVNISLENAVNAAQSANRAKSTFLSNMSHDIRTPMNAIIGFATLAMTNIGKEERVKDYLNKILSASNHLLSLINDILDMSRIESGKIHLEETEVSLSEVLHDLKTIVSGQINAKHLELFMDALEIKHETVYCDKTRLNQILLNLLSNAIKFTSPGGTVSVKISELPSINNEKGSYEIRVKDSGIGMPEEFVNKIFEPFEREKNSTVSRIQGTGLGMAITKNIVDMMGGSIRVITEVNKGSEFIVSLTLRIAEERTADEHVEELSGLKALVVDDDFSTCDSVTKMLTRIGMRSEWTLSGKEAVLRARQAIEIQDSFNAYIIDWRLPDLNGIEVAREIRKLNNETPIIVLTAYDWADIEEEAREAGVTAFCAKPLFMSDLRQSLLESLGASDVSNNKQNGPLFNEAFSNKHLLLVEDNELNSEIAYEILHDYGFRVDVAINGKEAFDKVADSKLDPYDLILMDIQMPIMNGLEATKAIRDIGDQKLSKTPIVAMTANAFDEDRKVASEAGMDGFITKPIILDEVISVISNILNKE
ncbi:MAG: response regulator, partial [Erysipelotrichaceae bacterium]